MMVFSKRRQQDYSSALDMTLVSHADSIPCDKKGYLWTTLRHGCDECCD